MLVGVRVNLRVQRFDPRHDREPSWARYRIEIPGHQTVLDALLLVERDLDPTLAFRRTCRSGICGACAALVNGKPALLCHVLVASLAATPGEGETESEVVIEPLPGFRILKDLVVDVEPMVGALGELEAWLVPSERYDGLLMPEVAQRLWSPAQCVLCGICASDSSVGPSVRAPAAIRALRLAHDPRDRVGLGRLERLGQLGALDGEFADRLRQVCPKAIDIRPLLPAGSRSDR